MFTPKLIVTGFEPFGNNRFNTSESVVKVMKNMEFSGVQVLTGVLPVSYNRVEPVLRTLLTSFKPDLAILTGINKRLKNPVLEKVAVNMQTSNLPDNDNTLYSSKRISIDGPDQMTSNLDFDQLTSSLKAGNFEFGISEDAGQFVCNTSYYHALRLCRKLNIKCIFVHLPQTEDKEMIKQFANCVWTIGKTVLMPPGQTNKSDLSSMEEALNFLYSFINYEKNTSVSYDEKNYNLENFKQLLEIVGNPHKNQKYIHIAGTKGKGSVSAIVSSILSAHGYRTGLYSSPHLVNINERFRIDGKAISNKEFVSEIDKIKTALSNCQNKLKRRYRTTFELLTATAFQYFKRNHLDFVILETGMGGRLDCTNVVTPAVSAVTRLDLDHTESLGNTLRDICREKLGISKPGVPLILGSQMPEIHKIINEEFKKLKGRIITAEDLINFDQIIFEENKTVLSMMLPEWKLHDVEFNLAGQYQLENLQTALSILLTLEKCDYIQIRKEALLKGIKQLTWPGRFTVLNGDFLSFPACHRVVVDGAHNPRAIESCLNAVKNCFPESYLTIVAGIAKNKNYPKMVNLLTGECDRFIATAYDNSRALTGTILADIARVQCSEVFSTSNLLEAIELIRRKPENDEVVLFTGSLYLAGEVLKHAGMEEKCLNLY